MLIEGDEIYLMDENKKRIFSAVDAQNLWFASKKFNKYAKVDYRKLYEIIYGNQIKRRKEDFNVYIANSANCKDLAASLEKIGYNSIIGYVEKEVNKIINLDVLITIDAIKNIDNYDVFVFCSGSGSFVYLLKELKLRNKVVELISFQHSASKSLFEFVDVIKFLNRDCLIVKDVKDINEVKDETRE